MPMRTRAGKGAFVIFLVLAGCPARFDPRAETKISSSDPEADHAYREARARLDIGDVREARSRFAAFREKYPNDPLAASARLGEARAALAMGEAKQAKELAEPLAGAPSAAPEDPAVDPMRARARWVLGLALHKTGEYQRSEELLKPFVNAIASGDDAVELHAVLADDASHLGESEDALREYGLYFQGARPAEKLYLRDRVSELVGKLSAGEALRLWNTLPKDGIAAAFLGRRVAADRLAAGDEATGRSILDESRNARERAGLEEARPAPRSSTAIRAIGCVLPLSGKGRGLGERALRGALLAAGLVSGQLPSAQPIELRVRDNGSDPARSAAAVEELAQEGVVAVLGPPERIEGQSVASKAESLGVPLIELGLDDARRGALTFKMARAYSATGQGLVRQALKSGARSLVVMAPDSTYGHTMAQAITDAAKAANRSVQSVFFPQAATSFAEQANRVKALAPDVLIVAAPAKTLEFMVGQLASSGVVRMANVPATGKASKLYATADGINAAFLNSTGKYLEGAVLAPSFYPDLSDARVSAFVERYRQAYNEEPTLLDALAFDAVRATRVALDHEGGAISREGVATQLAHLGESGVTGELAFTASGERSGTPPLFIVENGALRPLK